MKFKRVSLIIYFFLCFYSIVVLLFESLSVIFWFSVGFRASSVFSLVFSFIFSLHIYILNFFKVCYIVTSLIVPHFLSTYYLHPNQRSRSSFLTVHFPFESSAQFSVKPQPTFWLIQGTLCGKSSARFFLNLQFAFRWIIIPVSVESSVWLSLNPKFAY